MTPKRGPPGLLVVSHSGSHVSARASFFPNRSMVVSRRVSIQSLLRGGNKTEQNKAKQVALWSEFRRSLKDVRVSFARLGVFKGRALREGVGGLEEDY